MAARNASTAPSAYADRPLRDGAVLRVAKEGASDCFGDSRYTGTLAKLHQKEGEIARLSCHWGDENGARMNDRKAERQEVTPAVP